MEQKLLEKFFNKQCTPAEQKKVLSWYLSGEADQELAHKIEAYWKEEKKNIHDEWDKEGVFSIIEQKIKSQPQTPHQKNPKKKNRTNIVWKSWRYAAVLVIVMLAGVVVYLQNEWHQEELSSQLVEQKDPFILKKTAKGEKLSIILKDSTQIHLNAESTLRYKLSNSREVYLEGEAYFDVAHDTLHPFQIHTADLTTTVLGTSFNIKAFGNDDNIAVSVVSGKVKVESRHGKDQKAIQLIPGEQAVYQLEDTALATRLFSYDEVASWKDGKLFFKNASFQEVVKTLERWYGVEFVIQKSKIQNGFSGSYSKRSLESVLEGISFVLDFEYEIRNSKTIIIK